MENNFEILGITEDSSPGAIREAFRKLALRHHSDRGGEDERFKKIKQAYEDLKEGKKYPDTEDELKKKSRVYSSDTDDQIRRKNTMLAKDLVKDMKNAEEWIAALNRTNSTATRLFGSKTLGEIEFERKANGAVLIKGNFMAGRLTYDGPVFMQGNITSPSWSIEDVTVIRLTRGDFKIVNPSENKFKIDNGAKIIADTGNIVVGNVFGKKDKMPDPNGRVGIYNIREHRTELNAPRGKIIAKNITNTVYLNGDIIVVLNIEDDVKIMGRQILIYGNKITYDVEIHLVKNGSIQFFADFSIQGLSDDCIIKLENGKSMRLRDIKVKKIHDLAENLVSDMEKYGKNDTMVGMGFVITYDMLDNLEKKPANRSWRSRLGFEK